MAKSYKSAVVLTGDAKGAVNAANATQTELQKLNKTVKQGAADFVDMAKKTALFAAALGGTALATATVMVKKQLELIDSTAKTADKLGIATEKLTAMRIQAELTGVSTNTLDMGLQRMVRRVAEAAQGTGEASGALKELGIDARELAKLSPDKQFGLIADAMGNVGSQSDKVRLAFKLFDSEGVALVNTLKGGSAAMQETVNFTEEWGLAITRVDAAKIEQANDAMTLLGSASEGFWKQLTVKVSPAITGITGEIMGMGEAFGDASSLATAAFNKIVGATAFVMDAAGGVKRAFELIANGWVVTISGILAAAAETLAGFITTINHLPGIDFSETEKSLWSFVQTNKMVAKIAAEETEKIIMTPLAGEKFRQKIAEWQAESEKTAKTIADSADIATGAYDKTAISIDSLLVAKDDLKRATDLEVKSAYALASAYADTIGAAERENAMLARELQAIQGGAAALAAFNKTKAVELALRSQNAYKLQPAELARYKELIEKNYDLTAAITAQRAEAEETARVWEEATNRIDEAFANAWEGAFGSFSDFASSIKDAFKTLLANLAHMAITRPILISLGLGGSGSALAGGGSSGGGLLDTLSSGMSLSKLLSGGGALAGINSLLLQGGGHLISGIGSLGFSGTANMLANSMSSMAAMPGGMIGGLGISAGAGYVGSLAGNTLGGMFGKTAESSWGSAIGTAIGTAIMPGVGSAIGGLVGGFADAMFGGDGKKRVQLGVDTGDSGWDGYAVGETVTAASGLKLTARNLRAGAENDAVATALRDELALIDASLVNLFKSVTGEIVDFTGDVIGKDTSVKKGENQFKGFFGADGFNGLDPEEITAASEQFVRQWVDAANAELNASLDIDSFIALQRAGEPLYQTLARVTEQLPLVNQALEMLGMTALAFSADGMKAADGLIAAFGGMENMAGAMQAYQAVAYTEAERLAEMQTALATTFEQLGVVMPENIAGLRQVIEGLDVTTASGQEAFATLIQLAPVFNQVAEASAAAAQAQAEAERQIAVDAANEQLSLLEETINAEKSRITEIHNARMDQLDAERAAILQSVADARANIDTVFAAFQRGIDQRKQSITATAEAEIAAINSQRDGIIANYDDIAARINGSLDTVRESVEQLRRDADLLRSALGRIVSDNPAITLGRQQAGVSAIAGGATGDALERALTAATSATGDMFASRVDYERAQGRAGTAIAGRLGPADAALSKEEGILASLERQLSDAAAARDIELSLLDEQVQAVIDHRDKAIAGLEQQLELAQAQINAIDGTANNVATLTDVTSAISTYEQAQEMSIYQIEAIDRARLEQEKQFLRQTEYLDLQLEHNTALLENAIVQEANQRGIWGATLGVSESINRLTGSIASMVQKLYEKNGGYEAIIPLGRGDIPVVVQGNQNEAVAAEIRALRSEVSGLKTELQQIRTNTGDTAAYSRKWEYRGMPQTREDVA